MLSTPSVAIDAAYLESIAQALGEETVRQLHDKVLTVVMTPPKTYLMEMDLPLREPNVMVDGIVFDPQWLIPGSASSVDVVVTGGCVRVSLKGQVA